MKSRQSFFKKIFGRGTTLPGAPAGDPLSGTAIDCVWPWNYRPPSRPAMLFSGKPWPRISIVTPSFNQVAFIEETIRSVLLQGYPNLEYIVVDGGSTDGTTKILDRYRHELVVCISEPDKGQAQALNKGFRHATGEILAWLNSDDQYLPDTLVHVATAFEAYAADLVVGACDVINGHRREPETTHRCGLPLQTVMPLPLERMLDFEGTWLKGQFFFQPEVFLSRRIWEAAGGCLAEDLHFALDYELWLRLAELKATICHIPKRLAVFRKHDGQKTSFSTNAALFPEYTTTAAQYRRRLPPPKAPPTDKNRVPVRKSSRDDIHATIPKPKFADRELLLRKTATGTFYLPADLPRDAVACAIRTDHIFEQDIVTSSARFVMRGSTLLDIGANFGQTSLLFSRLTGDTGQVLSFEPNEFLFSVLQKNIQANHAHNIRAFLAAAYDRSGHFLPSPAPDSPHATTDGSPGARPDASPSNGVETLAIDDLDIQSPISLMRVKAQGASLFALRGAAETIRRHQMPVVFEYQEKRQNAFNTCFEDYLEFIRSISYRVERTIYDTNYLIVPGREKRFVAMAGHAGPLAGQQGRASPLPVAGVRCPAVSPSGGRRSSLCKFLKSRSEVDECTRFLHRHGYVSHNLVCKDWDLAHIIPEVSDGNFLDMGSSDSYILKNLALKRIRGKKCGIDLREPDVPVDGVEYFVGDLTDTKLPAQSFRNISCLSVLEHNVDFRKFAKEAARLLEPEGRLFVTFDYWSPKVTPPIDLYGLKWQPLDEPAVRALIATCGEHGLHPLDEMDWKIEEPVISFGYYSPHREVSYTFGMIVFENRSSHRQNSPPSAR